MDKKTWIAHMQAVSGGIIPPSQGGDPHDWDSALSYHKEQGNCTICKARIKTRQALLRVKGTVCWE